MPRSDKKTMNEKLINMIKESVGSNVVFSSTDLFNNPAIRKEYSLTSIRTILCSLSKRNNSGVKRYSQGHYYIQSFISGTSVPEIPAALEVIEKEYIGLKNEIGCYIGECFANSIGLSNNVPGVLEIASNKEKSNGRCILVGGQKVKIKKPLVEINKSNSKILPLLDLFSSKEYQKINKLLVLDYCKKEKITLENIRSVYLSLPVGAKRRCHIGELINGTI
jgi:hypothetical protein